MILDIGWQFCNYCMMDTSDSFTVFDENGVYQLCNEYEKTVLPRWNIYGKSHEAKLNQIVAEIKAAVQLSSLVLTKQMMCEEVLAKLLNRPCIEE